MITDYRLGQIFGHSKESTQIYILACVGWNQIALISVSGGRITDPVKLPNFDFGIPDNCGDLAKGGFDLVLLANSFDEWLNSKIQKFKNETRTI
jgi:hypothetical protein